MYLNNFVTLLRKKTQNIQFWYQSNIFLEEGEGEDQKKVQVKKMFVGKILLFYIQKMADLWYYWPEYTASVTKLFKGTYMIAVFNGKIHLIVLQII